MNFDDLLNGKNIIGSRDYMLVLFITCFLPFVRSSVPLLHPKDLKRAKKRQKDYIKFFEYPIDESINKKQDDPNQVLRSVSHNSVSENR